jgi:hypothetical protein
MNTLVFYAGRCIEECEGGYVWHASDDTPEGAFIQSGRTGQWYCKQHGMNAMNAADVPKDIKLLAMIMKGGL